MVIKNNVHWPKMSFQLRILFHGSKYNLFLFWLYLLANNCEEVICQLYYKVFENYKYANLQVHFQFCLMARLKDRVISITELFLSYLSKVVLYIIHILCYPLISHIESTQDNHHLNVSPTPCYCPNTFSIFPLY